MFFLISISAIFFNYIDRAGLHTIHLPIQPQTEGEFFAGVFIVITG
jgi:hypothetical protein